MSIFDELLAIKRFRESQAETAMRQQRFMLHEAIVAREAAQALLQRLLEEGLQTEHRIYQELCQRIVRLRDIEQVQQTVVSLRRQEAAQHDTVQASIQAQTQAQRLLDTARFAHQQASRQTSKFIDLARIYDAKQALEAERKEDLEMEEAASITRDREDWSASDAEGD